MIDVSLGAHLGGARTEWAAGSDLSVLEINLVYY